MWIPKPGDLVIIELASGTASCPLDSWTVHPGTTTGVVVEVVPVPMRDPYIVVHVGIGTLDMSLKSISPVNSEP